jgi:hypothetical protein
VGEYLSSRYLKAKSTAVVAVLLKLESFLL